MKLRALANDVKREFIFKNSWYRNSLSVSYLLDNVLLELLIIQISEEFQVELKAYYRVTQIFSHRSCVNIVFR
jgi:hypothetical protein